MTKMEERAVELLDKYNFAQIDDTYEYLREFSAWCGKYSRFGIDMRDVFVETTIAEMRKRKIFLTKI